MTYFISHAKGENLDELKDMTQRGRVVEWTVNRNAQRGDRIAFYSPVPIQGMIAVGTVLTRPVDGAARDFPGHGWAKVRVERLIDPPVSLASLRARLPEWKWLKIPLSPVRVPDEIVNALVELLREDGDAPARPDDLVNDASPGGGGFGEAEMNRRVELRAVAHVRRRYTREGWTIIDRQGDACGYDLQANRGKAELHLEVKGAMGPAPEFILTANEMNCAKNDPTFRLCVVTNALDKGARLRVYSGRRMRAAFRFDALSYRAKLVLKRECEGRDNSP